MCENTLSHADLCGAPPRCRPPGHLPGPEEQRWRHSQGHQHWMRVAAVFPVGGVSESNPPYSESNPILRPCVSRPDCRLLLLHFRPPCSEASRPG